VPTRWARVSLCALVLSTVFLAAAVATVPAAATVHHESVTAGASSPGPALTLRAQTSWVTPTAPWFTLSLGVGSSAGPAANLHVQLTFYGRIGDATHMAQATNGSPGGAVLGHLDAAVAATADGLGVVACAVVLPNNNAEAPTPAAGTLGVCPPGAQTVSLHCQPDEEICGDVYPVSVALYRQGTSAPLARFTTFLTYQEPEYSSSIGPGGPLRVGLVLPVASRPSSTLSAPTAGGRRTAENLIGQIFAYRGVALTLAADPSTVSNLTLAGGVKGKLAVKHLAALASPADGDQLLSQPYVPIDLAALVGAGLVGDVGGQLVRGGELLRLSGLHPSRGTWVATSSQVTTANAGDLATGLTTAHAGHLILNDSDLNPTGSNNLTPAQPFTLPLGHNAHVTAAGADSQVDALFTAHPRDPLLAANQLLANLEFIHFENASLREPRGVVIEPPQFWKPPPGFLTVLLYGLTHNPALSPVNLDTFFAQVHKGDNKEPTTRHLKTGPSAGPHGITTAVAKRLDKARDDLASFTKASTAAGSRPAIFAGLSDLLLRTESQTFDQRERAAALGVYDHHFDGVVGQVTLAAQQTITFTSRTAAIPVSVLSSAPFPVKVVVSLQSDKFTFPDGASRTVVLQRPTTPVRLQARSRTSGDHLPVVITLTTPDGQLVLARTSLSVRSTSISVVGVALTVLAALVLLVWWFRTWRRGRRSRPRAA
jgi:Family of unknown function (DUF6049)